MKKLIVMIMISACMVSMTACGSGNNNAEAAQTWYSSEEIQQPEIMYNGQVYRYFATGFDEPLPENFNYVGSISDIDNVNEPKEDFHGARVESGQEVYANETDSDTIYIKYESGYARFSIKNS